MSRESISTYVIVKGKRYTPTLIRLQTLTTQYVLKKEYGIVALTLTVGFLSLTSHVLEQGIPKPRSLTDHCSKNVGLHSLHSYGLAC